MADKTTTTLRELLTDALIETGETWDDIVGIDIKMEYDANVETRDEWHPLFYGNEKYPEGTKLSAIPKEDWLDLRFDSGYGTSVPIEVTIWTKYFIHFNYEYDGYDFIISRPRNPPRSK